MSPDNLIICRCEEVTYAEIEEAKFTGAFTSQEIKLATRAGMGFCQGRVCRSLLETIVDEPATSILLHPSTLTIHQPVRPVQVGKLKGEYA